jgi:hypothetical protein
MPCLQGSKDPDKFKPRRPVHVSGVCGRECKRSAVVWILNVSQRLMCEMLGPHPVALLRSGGTLGGRVNGRK